MKTILIDLKSVNHNKLKELALHFDWCEDVLIMFKNNDIIKIWVDVDTKDVIAYCTKKNSEIQIGHEFMEKLNSMEGFKLPIKIKIVNLSLDDILDKISKTGIDSLTINEKKFLDNLNL